MRIEQYSPKYREDIKRLIVNFYTEALEEYNPRGINMAVVEHLIDKYAEYSLLLIVDNKCEGVIAGECVSNMFDSARVFQEVIWYINRPFRKYGVKMIKMAEDMLRSNGFKSMIMACLHNSKTDKVMKFYQRIGFVPAETHFIKELA